MSHENETHTSGLLYFMPGWIFEHPELSQTEKMIYALLSGLAHGNQEKTCFPSDEYIAKRIGIRKKGANEAVASLTKVGAISKITVSHEKNPFRKKRIITVYLSPQKTFTNTGKPDPREPGKPDLPDTGKPDHSNKGIRNKEESTLKGAKESASRTARAPHVSSSSKEHKDLVRDFGEERTQEAYERLSEWKEDTPKSKWKKNDHLAIRRWVIDAIKEKALKMSKDPENRIKEVHGYIESHFKRSVLKRAEKENKIMVLRDRIEILGVFQGSAEEDRIIDFRNPNAKDRIDQRIRMLDL